MANTKLIHDNLSNEFLACLKSSTAKEVLLEEIYSNCSSHLDNNFPTEFNSQDKSQTYSRLWELVICYSLLNSSLNLPLGNNMKKGGHPDFSLLNYPRKGSTTWIECVCPNEGNNYISCHDTYKERVNSAIKDKSEKIIGYKNNGKIKEEDSVILAINSGLLLETREVKQGEACEANPDLTSAILGQHVMVFDAHESNYAEERYVSHDIKKGNGTVIPIGTLESYTYLKEFNLLVGSKIKPFTGISTKPYEFLFHSENDAETISADSLFHFWPDPDGIIDSLDKIAAAIQTNMETKR